MVMFWLVAALLCGCVVLPLLISPSTTETTDDGRSAASLAIYKDQLTEIDRDVAAGTVSLAEAEAHRIEVSRRLLAVGRETATAKPAQTTLPKLLVLIVPVVAGLIYSQVGRFGMADVPRAARLAAADTTNDWPALIARVEQQLDKNPKDVEGWQLLVPNYLSMGRYADAANAMAKIAALTGPTAELYANMAEALVFDAQGLLTAQSINLVDEALKLDAKHPKALFYKGMEQVQEGKLAEAKVTYQGLLAAAPPDAPWLAAVKNELAKLEPNAAAPKLSAEQMQDASAMAPQDQMAMIRTMVDGLDEKLKTNPDNPQGWLRLIRARTVLGEANAATAALSQARTVFAAKPDTLKLLNDLASELNLK